MVFVDQKNYTKKSKKGKEVMASYSTFNKNIKDKKINNLYIESFIIL
jgi:hypothetical protein